jgi:hypothetical protein
MHVRYRIKLSREKKRRWVRAAYIYPAIKQYTASRMTDSSGSTSYLRKLWKLLCIPATAMAMVQRAKIQEWGGPPQPQLSSSLERAMMEHQKTCCDD